MPDPELDELITTERVALVVYRLTLGGRYTTNDIAEMTGITYQGAAYMMAKISRMVPVVRWGGKWLIAPKFNL
jgi:hypothetical protein